MLYKLFLLYYLYKSDTSFFLLTLHLTLLFMSLKTYTVSSSRCPFFYAILERLCFIVVTKERINLSNEFIEADVTYIIKELQSFSVHQRRNCRNHCSDYRIAAVNRTGTCIWRRTGSWYLHCDRCRICHLCTRRKQCTDCRTNGCIRNNRCRHCCQRRNGWTCHCDKSSPVSFWF